ncbi:response regulator with CheY-like receiver domain and winged-helix DNA-binding domain [Halobacteroides halobius DSM 5150]|uniref:Stage 0 sporulation protein A homolog n=1 Tax=Halobacteroides halobius (strain ATCC 35273 / DSM 5150 / MD-1) TaxID=748449 RepID=L0K8F9_HALHC|nr:response regulator transcription factor [Halobacteroides halobius]AGB41577.1 response regulator with CheY-like receiver domain and winged-helix DNA-binding domain [Halobacteroides halobius DSM 5150]
MEDKEILIVDDDQNVHEILSLYFKKEGCSVLVANDGAEALEKADNNEPDLIILDIMMPKLDGLEVIKNIRQNNDVPVIFLSAKSEEFDRILGLELGADDYVTKPFSPREIIARAKAIFKRIKQSKQNNEPQRDLVIYSNLAIDPINREVKVKGEEIELSPKEYELLLLLAQHPNQVFKRERLYDRIWGMDHYGDMRTVDVHINWLRDKLDLDYIQTVWGVGYKFVGAKDDK